jgi:dihydrofolate reductase
MRKVILSMMVSLDGYIEGRDPSYNWHNWNEEMAAYMMDFFGKVDTFIYGRKSYEDMVAYWPPLEDDFANIMNQTPKLVYSRSLEEAVWNATLVREVSVSHIQKLKQEPGKDIVLFAGADLAASFMEKNLIDEYRLIINPLVLGGGKPLFKNMSHPFHLKFKQSINFECGNIILIYEKEK